MESLVSGGWDVVCLSLEQLLVPQPNLLLKMVLRATLRVVGALTGALQNKCLRVLPCVHKSQLQSLHWRRKAPPACSTRDWCKHFTALPALPPFLQLSTKHHVPAAEPQGTSAVPFVATKPGLAAGN